MDNTHTIYGEIAEIVRKETRFLRHYWGEVLDNKDELNRGRVLVSIPRLGWFTMAEAGWCWPRDKHGLDVPSVGEHVEVYFMEGDPSYPVYMGNAHELKGNMPADYEKPTKHVLYQDKDSGEPIEFDSETKVLTFFRGTEHYVLGDELKAQLQKNVDALTQLQSDFTSWTPIPNDGGAALKTLLSSGFLAESIAILNDILSEVIQAK